MFKSDYWSTLHREMSLENIFRMFYKEHAWLLIHIFQQITYDYIASSLYMQYNHCHDHKEKKSIRHFKLILLFIRKWNHENSLYVSEVKLAKFKMLSVLWSKLIFLLKINYEHYIKFYIYIKILFIKTIPLKC